MSIASLGTWQDYQHHVSDYERDATKSQTHCPLIYVLDEDLRFGHSLSIAAKRVGWEVVQFSSVGEFLDGYDLSRPACLLLDFKLPPSSGHDVQQRLAAHSIDLPIIAISGYANVRMAVDVMSRGAVTLLEKPIQLDELLIHIRRAFRLDVVKRAARTKQAQAEAQLARLTRKEREVLELVTSGKTNKQIAAQLHISIRAVEDRRARLMKRLGVRSLAELVQISIAGT